MLPHGWCCREDVAGLAPEKGGMPGLLWKTTLGGAGRLATVITV
jgi:hypothetical protein